MAAAREVTARARQAQRSRTRTGRLWSTLIARRWQAGLCVAFAALAVFTARKFPAAQDQLRRALVGRTQVCPPKGAATAAPCRSGKIAPYIVDLDTHCFGSMSAKLADTLQARVGETSGKQIPLWLSSADAKTMQTAPCVLGVVRDYNCTMCDQLNMTVPVGASQAAT